MIFDTDSFFYVLIDKDGEWVQAAKYCWSEDGVGSIADAIKKEKLNTLSFNKVRIFSKDNNFTFIPSSEYNYASEEKLTKNAFQSAVGEVSVDILDDDRIHILHNVEASSLSDLEMLEKSPNVQHISYAWISRLRKPGIFVFIGSDYVEILVNRDGKFAFYNHFDHQGFEDIFYFVMLTFNQLSLDPGSLEVYIEGNNNVKKELLPLLSKYVRNIDAIDLGLNDSKLSEFLDLHLVSLCE